MRDSDLEQGDATSTPWELAAAAFERVRAGDAGAMDDLVRCMTPVLWHVVRAYRLDPDAAQDVVQSTWLVFVRRQASITEPRAVAKWLTTTARRDAARVGQRASRAMPVEEEKIEPRLPRQVSAEAVALEDHESTVLWRAVNDLDARCQRLLRVIAFEQRPDYAGLAEDLGMPVGSIGPTRGRCLTKLRRLLAQEDETYE